MKIAHNRNYFTEFGYKQKQAYILELKDRSYPTLPISKVILWPVGHFFIFFVTNLDIAFNAK